jgi:predicted nucleic acid-binding protein
MDEALVSRAEQMAWQYGLRGYDAVHLAAAKVWQQEIGHPVVLATFDRELREAAALVGLEAWPEQAANVGFGWHTSFGRIYESL